MTRYRPFPPLPLDVVCGIVVHDKDVLLFRRAPHVDFGNQWCFPGGKVEAHETHVEALWRELAEETGYVPQRKRPWRPVGTVRFDPPLLSRTTDISYYETEAEHRRVRAVEPGTDVEWVPFATILRLPLTPGTQAILERGWTPELFWKRQRR